MELLARIAKSLLTIIPNERGFRLQDASAPYSSDPMDLLDNPPMPNGEVPRHAPRTTHHIVPYE